MAVAGRYPALPRGQNDPGNRMKVRISEENFRNFTAVSKDLWLILKTG